MTLLSFGFSEGVAWSESSSEVLWLNDAYTFPKTEKNEEKREDENSDKFLDLISPHIPSLRRYLQARIPMDDIDDVIQDVVLGILRRVTKTEIERPKCYLFQAAQATLIDRHRRQNTRKAMFHCELMEEMHPVDDLHPLHILIARDEFQMVEEVLGRLPERTREIIIAVRLEGESLKALAMRYGISTSAIEKHVTKAMKTLEKSRNMASPSKRTGASNFCCAA